MSDIDLPSLRKWIGRTERRADLVTPRLVASLRATLDAELDEAVSSAQSVPYCLHWCLAPQLGRTSDLGSDGHGARGSFLPPVPLPRRMWAASEVAFNGSFRLGDQVERVSRIDDVTAKTGRSGLLCFVILQHDLYAGGRVVVTERQEIVYRDLPLQEAAAPVPSAPRPAARWQRIVRADPVLLFRYSALTFNSHRIHYDSDYCREHERYPGLVVQGPLQASLLLEFACSIRADRSRPRRFSFRAVAPLFAGGAMILRAAESAEGLLLSVSGEDDRPTMQAKASW